MSEQFKIRCSQIGKIMSASGKLIDGNKTYCENWVKEKLYSRRKEIHSKYLDKGNAVEDDSIQYISDKLGISDLKKNEQFYSNGFMEGTPDVIAPELLIEVKNSWDCFTFPLFEPKIPTSDYFWQAQGYMHLTGLKKAKLIYVLMDAPPELVDKELSYAMRGNFSIEEAEYNKIVASMTYANIPDKLRLKIFDIDYDAEKIEQIEAKVGMCRQYICELNENIDRSN